MIILVWSSFNALCDPLAPRHHSHSPPHFWLFSSLHLSSFLLFIRTTTLAHILRLRTLIRAQDPLGIFLQYPSYYFPITIQFVRFSFYSFIIFRFIRILTAHCDCRGFWNTEFFLQTTTTTTTTNHHMWLWSVVLPLLSLRHLWSPTVHTQYHLRWDLYNTHPID